MITDNNLKAHSQKTYALVITRDNNLKESKLPKQEAKIPYPSNPEQPLNSSKHNLKISFPPHYNTCKDLPYNPKNKDKDIIEEILQKGTIIEPEHILYGPSLTIIQETGNILLSNKIHINPGGLMSNNHNSKPKNGLVLFGPNQSKLTNVSLNLTNYSQYETFPYLFGIFFRKETKSYYIQPYLRHGDYNKLLFVKLYNGQEMIIYKKEIVNIGGGIFQMNVINKTSIEITMMSVVNDMGESEEVLQKRIFDKEKETQIIFGRSENCTYAFPNNKNFSRKQAIVFYRNGYWVIKDGNGVKGSTNGLWILGIHSFKIWDNLVVEVLGSKFKFVLEQNKL